MAFIISEEYSFQNIYHDNPILYVFVFGLIGAKITNRLVVAHMCKGEITHRDASMLAPLLLIINQYFNTVIPEIYILYASLVSKSPNFLLREAQKIFFSFNHSLAIIDP